MNLSSRSVKTEVLVVGAGPVGLLAALLLHRRGVAVQVVDEAWRATARSYAAALHQATLELLADLEIDISTITNQHRLTRIGFYDQSGKRAEALFGGICGKFPELVVVPQNELEAHLEAELKRRGVNVNWSHRLARLAPTTDGVDVGIDVLERTSSGYAYATTTVEVARSYNVQARYVLGADGHSSVVRRQLGIKYRSVGPAAEFDVFEFQSDDSNQDEMRVLFDRGTTNVLWTLPGGRQRWSFQVEAPSSQQRDRTKSRLMLSIPGESSIRTSSEELSKYLEQRAAWYRPKLGDIAWAGDVRFEPHLAEACGRGNVWLLGDAVHQTGPVGIQSMNVGLREARQLSDIVVNALQRRQADFGFVEYAASRNTEWRRLLGLEPYFAARSGCDAWLAERITRILPCLPASGPSLEILASRLGFALAHS